MMKNNVTTDKEDVGTPIYFNTEKIPVTVEVKPTGSATISWTIKNETR